MGGFYGLQGSPQEYDGMQIMPSGRERWGNDVISQDHHYLKADITLTLMDIWILNPAVVRSFTWCPYFPIDHDPMPPGVADVLRFAHTPIVYSKFGQRMAENEGFKVEYVPHAVDTKIFKPMDKSAARAELGISEDTFLVGIVAANKGAPSRKCFDQQIRAFKMLYEKHKDCMLYIHTDFVGNGGVNVGRLIALSGLPTKVIAQPDQYKYKRGWLQNDYLQLMYSAMDVLSNASKGEGFGLTTIEAQACGTPPIVTGATASPELVPDNVGWVVSVDEDDKYFSQNSYQFTPKVSLIYEALEAAYQESETKRSKRKALARKNALLYDADHVTATYWKPVLEKIAAKLEIEGDRKKIVTIPTMKEAAVDK
jgi:glycosyltransferase involved in cell wall biosynthesis